MPLAAGAALDARQQEVLREGHRIESEAARMGIGEGSMRAVEREALERARAFAKSLGGLGLLEDAEFLARLPSKDLLQWYARGYTAGTTPQLEALVMRYHDDPNVGPEFVSMLGRHRSRPLVDALLADLRSGRLPYLNQHFEALLRSDAPGVEAEMVPLMGDERGVAFGVVRELVTARRFAGAAPRVAQLLKICPDSQVAELAAHALNLGVPEVMEAIAQRLVALARQPASRETTKAVDGVIELLAHAKPWLVLPRTAFSAGALAGLPEPGKGKIASMLQARDGYERRFALRTTANFAYWVRRGDQEISRRFLEEGFDVRSEGPDGSAIQVLMNEGNVSLVVALLERGADPNARSRDGLPLLLYIVSRSGGRDGEAEALPAAAAVLARGGNANVRDPLRGATALHMAVRNRSLALVTLLLARGADVNAGAPDDDRIDGLTPTQLAQDLGLAEIESLLRARGGVVSNAYLAERALQKTKRKLAGILLAPFFAGPMH